MSLYSLFRILLAVILFIIGFVIIRKLSSEKRRFTVVILAVLCAGLYSVFELIPIENKFISFTTPQDVISYYSNNTVTAVIEGADSCLVFSDGSSKQQLILKKNENGWEIRTGLNIKTEAIQNINTSFVYTLKLKDSEDVYIKVTDTKKSDLILTDNRDSTFYETADGTYHAYISDFWDGYILNIDGEEINF